MPKIDRTLPNSNSTYYNPPPRHLLFILRSHFLVLLTIVYSTILYLLWCFCLVQPRIVAYFLFCIQPCTLTHSVTLCSLLYALTITSCYPFLNFHTFSLLYLLPPPPPPPPTLSFLNLPLMPFLLHHSIPACHVC